MSVGLVGFGVAIPFSSGLCLQRLFLASLDPRLRGSSNPLFIGSMPATEEGPYTVRVLDPQ